jgi:putative MATE family efflux protein
MGSLSSEEESNTTTSTTPAWTPQQVKLALPALIAMLADPLLSLVDTAYVGRLGTNELASLGACTSVFHLAFNTFRATTFATTSLVGRYHPDEADADELQAVTRLSLQFGLLLGVAVSLALLCLGTPILAAMGVPRASPLFAPAAAYLRTRAWAAPCVALTSVATGIFRGAGNTVVPLLASLLASGMNLVLDPVLMFGRIGWGVRGAAAATAVSQVGATLLLVTFLVRRGHLRRKTAALSKPKRRQVLKTIFQANLAMMAKQGSLLLGWAYVSAQATRLGAAHVAAHQVALSVWLVLALILDSNAVGAQVLLSRHYQNYGRDRETVYSLLRYQLKLAVGQGLVAMLVIHSFLAPWVPTAFATDAAVCGHLQSLMPTLAGQQLLVSLTLVVEALATATQQFPLLATGTMLSTALAIFRIRTPTTVTGLWNSGIVTLFAGRLVTATVALGIALKWPRLEKE